MCENSGFCGSIVRVLLTIINIILFAIGATIFVIAAILQWDDGLIIGKIDKELKDIIDITAFEELSVALLILGGAIMLVSVVGLIGACCASKFFLIIYEIVLIVLFIAHIVIVIIVVVEAPKIKDEYKKQLNESVVAVNNAEPSQYDEKCKSLKALSEIFDCCGYKDASDFRDPAARDKCCKSQQNDGCADKVIKTFEDDAVNILVIPNAVVLAIELIFIIGVPFLIGRLSKKDKYDGTLHYHNKY